MKLLAVDSSTAKATVALYQDGVIAEKIEILDGKTHSETLVPMIKTVLERTRIAPGEIDYYAAAIGPGSFTGLRIGVSTIKAMAMAVEKPCVGVPTLDALAYNGKGFDGILCPMIDARNDQVYTAIYYAANSGEQTANSGQSANSGEQTANSAWTAIGDHDVTGAARTASGERLGGSIGGEAGPLPQRLSPYMAKSVGELLEDLRRIAQGKDVLLLGDGAERHAAFLAAGLEGVAGSCRLAPAEQRLADSASVAFVGADMVVRGLVTDSDALAPDYLRKSSAEQARERRENL